MNMHTAPLILIVIPVFNHAATLRQVVSGALELHPHVLVVDDGSTDMPQATGPEYTAGHPLHALPVHCVRHACNMGKGKAILTGADYARTMGMSHIITLDADAQHYPSDLPAFIEAVRRQPLALFVGTRDFSTPNVPKASRFGRAFSNFWYKVQTGQELGDTQSGFRAYPLAIVDRLALRESRYSFEIEVLVRAAWAGFEVLDIPVRVHYAPGAERVSHFHPIMDNVRLSILNTRLTIRAIMPIPQKRFEQDAKGIISVLHPLRSLRVLLTRHETPRALALAGALGMFIGTLPLIGLHSILIIVVLGSLKLNKIAGLATSQLCMPLPALCIEAGYYLRHGHFLTDISWQTLGREALQRLAEWILGAAVLAPILALAVGLIVYVLARIIQRGLRYLPEQTP